ncbi:MAG: class I SAM-dependent methyltransferase [Thermodesulfobacteriota bacterium]
MNCRFCSNEFKHEFIDLVNSPPSNSFLAAEELNNPETFYPLRIFVCDKCFLVQIDEYKKSDEIFSEKYAYFSSFSVSWLEQARKYVEMIIKRLNLNKDSFVIEIASNDGYLLQFVKERGIPCLGIEPSSNTARVAREKKGIEVIEKFFYTELAEDLKKQGRQADLIIGNNVLAHVPLLNNFVKALYIALKPNGTITLEFPHIMQLIEQNQFDTIYHEHFSYFTFSTVCKVFDFNGLSVYDVEELPTHGGSLRIYAKRKNDNTKLIGQNVKTLLDKEAKKGMNNIAFYTGFQEKANKVKYDLLQFLIEQKGKNALVVAYGAAAKGNTLLNYCGIKKDLIEFVVDASPHKQGKYLPGSHIPVVQESEIRKVKPDFVIILPWNIKDEIMNQLGYIREWDAKFVVPIPELLVF